MTQIQAEIKLQYSYKRQNYIRLTYDRSNKEEVIWKLRSH